MENINKPTSAWYKLEELKLELKRLERISKEGHYYMTRVEQIERAALIRDLKHKINVAHRELYLK
jgi:hypothetical protein